MIERGAIVDLLVRDGESLVLTEHQCLRLSGVPTAIIEFLARPRQYAEVESHVAAVFGPPPEGRLDAVLAELAEQGLVKF